MSSNSSGNRVNVPEAKNALDNMKYEVARELGINLKQGYNGNLSARDNGYVGGYMVNNNQINIPEARKSMYDMKHEVANELGITLNKGYNGNLTSKDAGSIGGYMVKKMIEAQERAMAQNQQ